jgi:exopolysaccharide biosynthesis polyprenyl glycosylphosphotransferase
VRTSGSHAEVREGRVRSQRRFRRPTPAHGVPLPQFDVRVTRELAHRRYVVSILRQVLRVATLNALDAVTLFAAAWAAAYLSDIPSSVARSSSMVVFTLVGLHLMQSYRPGDARRDANRLATGVLVGAALAAVTMTLDASWSSRPYIVYFGMMALVGLILERRAVDEVVQLAYRKGLGLRRALIVARADELQPLLTDLAPEHAGRPAEDQVIAGYVTPDIPADDALGTVDDMVEVLQEHQISEVLLATELEQATVTRVTAACFELGVRVLVIPSAPQPDSGWAELTKVGRLPAYPLHPARLELPALVLKRASDLVMAGIGLVFVTPLMALIALGIKLDSRGPVFFRQRRVGLGGREFMMWKFRSMKAEAESEHGVVAHLNPYNDGRLFKLQGDPRITRVGAILRRFSMDELPQLFNVMRGDMSLVGPRPPLPAEVRRYEPRHLVRLSVVPGLTGPWQVNGRNLITDFEEVVRLERAYIENWSLRSDISIILRTFGVVLTGRGAY